MDSARTKLWHGSTRAALITSLATLVGLLTLILVLRRFVGWPPDSYLAWVVAGAAIFAMIPVILILMQFLPGSGVRIEVPGGLKLAFEAATTTAATVVRSASLSENLGTPDAEPLTTSSLQSIAGALRQAHDSDVTVVDLRRGRTWWESRLFILVAGAARRGRPQAIAFTGDCNGNKGVFLGWAAPDRLLEMHLDQEIRLREAHRRAAAKAALYDLQASGQPGLPFISLPHVDGFTDAAFAFELFLQAELDTPEFGGYRRHVTPNRLSELYRPDLAIEQVDLVANDETLVELLKTTRREFFAVENSGRFHSLVPREVVICALLVRLARGLTMDPR